MKHSSDRKSKIVAIASVTVASVMVVGGAAYAAIPDNGVITGCYTRSGGTLRVIDSSVVNCKSSETKLTWNVGGQPGVDGEDGADGVSGYVLVHDDRVFEPGTTSSFGGLSVACPAGTKVLGGGGAFLTADGTPVSIGDNAIIASYPKSDSTGWQISYNATDFFDGDPASVRAYATCAAVL